MKFWDATLCSMLVAGLIVGSFSWGRAQGQNEILVQVVQTRHVTTMPTLPGVKNDKNKS